MNERMETTLTTSQFFDMLKNQKLYSLWIKYLKFTREEKI